MAERRQATIYLNGKPVETQIKSLISAKQKLNAEIEKMIIGSDEYVAKAEELKKVNGILDTHRRGLSDVGKGYNSLTTGGLTKLGALAAGAFSADIILSYGKHLFDLSGQMELLEQRARTVFGEVFPQVTAAAEKNAAAIGLTESQYINAATAIGDFLVPMQFTREEAATMSTQLVNLSGALAEWEGGQRSATEVSTILSKAMLGEREELKQLGIALSEEDVQNRIRAKGLQGLTGEYAKQAEAIATIEIITESSADAITAFANSSDTLARKQAALRAEITNISEKLSATLYPVFERLVGIAGSVAGGLKNIADGFTSLVNPAKSSSEAFDDQAAKVKNLEAELPPLLQRYDELKGKSNLSKTEQKELAKVIQDIGILTPTAITEIDNYGKALGISASASREFLQAEKARLLVVNDAAITDNFRAAVRVKEQRDKLKKEIESGVKELATVTLAGTTRQYLDLTAEEITQKNEELNKLTQRLTGYRAELKRLKGQPLTEPGATGTTAPDREGILQSAAGVPTEKELEKARKELEKNQQDIQKILEKFRLENYLAQLDDDQKKIEQLRAKYDAEIDEVKKLEEKKVKGATEARIELERLKEEEINTLTTELLTARYLKEEETQKELDEKKAAAIGERVAKELEARAASEEAINEFVLSEYEKGILELENQYLELLNTTGLGEDQKLALLRAYEEKKAALRKEFADKEKTETITKRKEQLEILSQSYAAYSNIIGGALTALGGILGEQTAASKVLSLAQIAFNTASAISSAIAAGAGLTFPANLGAIATGVTAVLTNFAAARKIFNDAPAIPQRYTGGFFDVTGQDDGRSYNAQYLGSPGTGLLPDRPVLLASERGQEYLVSNPDLQNPRVLNYVRAIENIRTARTGGGTPQFSDGGFTTGAAGEGSSALAQLAPLLMQMAAVLGSLDSTLGNGIEAKLNDETAVALVQRFRVLNKASGGVL